ncbi:MAG: PDZ domain-containing protein, partial [Tannerella sp.]|nr:PDZ domain-containing protein [Tannerella sp.]
MKKNFRCWKPALFGLLLLTLAPHQVLAQETGDKRFETAKQLEIFNAVVKEMEMFYVDSINLETTVRRGIDAMLAGLDPYTVYIPEQDMDELDLLKTGEYGGIGAYITKRGDGGGVIVSEIIEGMPAMKAGLLPGDRFLAIDTTNVKDFPSDKVSALLKGVPNTKVKIKIQRPGEKKPRTVEVTRKQVVVDQVVYYGVRGKDTGYIYLRGFTAKSAGEVKAAFEDLRKNHHIRSLV